MKLEHLLIPCAKINSKWIKDLYVRPETIKLLEENIGKTLANINHSRILYDPPPRILEIKAKIHKWQVSNKRCSKSLVIREMQIKTIIRYRFTSTRIAEIEKTVNNSKRSNRQRINLKNIQATPPAQFQKNK